jgi:hypothetical protein
LSFKSLRLTRLLSSFRASDSSSISLLWSIPPLRRLSIAPKVPPLPSLCGRCGGGGRQLRRG